MIDLTDRVALVTGSSRGIGRATAIKLAQAGANLVINYIANKPAAMEVAETARQFGVDVAVVRADVSEREDIDQTIDFVRREFGGLDIVVSNAATGGFRPLMATTDSHFESAMNMNVRPLIYLIQAASEMLEQSPVNGKVVAISSHGAFMALPMYGTIGTSKAALESLMRHFALELGDRNINFNVVRAGLVETDSTRMLPGSDQMFAGRAAKTMTGQRQLEADDVANTVLFLCSPMSDQIQGETLTVDGGAAIHV